MATYTIQVVHSIPGRMRIKVVPLKGNPVLAAEIQQRLLAAPAVREAAVNPLTGSVVMLYDPESIEQLGPQETYRALLGTLADEAEIVYEPAIASQVGTSQARYPSDLSRQVKTLCGTMNDQVCQSTSGAADLRALVPATLLLLGVGRLLFVRPVQFPGWHNLLWYAYSSFQGLNK
jgi:hypothetical protein